MIEKGKIPVAIVSFDLKHPEEGPFARLRSPFYDLEAGDFVVVSDGSHNPIPRIAVVRQVEWITPPYNSFHSPACILTYLNVKALLEDSMESQKDAYEEAQRIIRISDEVRISLDEVRDFFEETKLNNEVLYKATFKCSEAFNILVKELEVTNIERFKYPIVIGNVLLCIVSM